MLKLLQKTLDKKFKNYILTGLVRLYHSSMVAYLLSLDRKQEYKSSLALLLVSDVQLWDTTVGQNYTGVIII